MTNIQNIAAAVYGAPPLKAAPKASEIKTLGPQPAIVQAGEKVEFSATSVSITRLREELDKLPEVRIKLVEDIKEKIRQNNYPFITSLNSAVDNMIANHIL